MRRRDRWCRMQIGLVEFGEIRDTEQPEANAIFLFQEFQYTVTAGSPRRSHAVEIKAADRHRIGATRHALDHIGAATKTTVDNNLRAATHGAHDFLQNVD